MLIQDKFQTQCPNKNNILINYPEIINDKNISVASIEDSSESNINLILDSSRRKFESEIGRDIVHERRMRKELTENSSSTGKLYAYV